MIIISDTTPLITLIKIGELDLLRDLFGMIYIPKEVYDELTIDKNYVNEKQILDNATYIKIQRVDEDKVKNIIKETGLDKGESAAISLYEEQKDKALLIIDERKGREIAKKRNIKIAGTIGLLALANKKNIRTKNEILRIVELIKEKRSCYSYELFDVLITNLV